MSRDIQIIVPPLGESVTEATLAKWLKAEGSPVAQDEPVVELETDKVTLEISAPASGFLKTILVPEGGIVTVGACVGSVAVGGEAPIPSPVASPGSGTKPEGAMAMPSARKLMAEAGLEAAAVSGTGKGGRILKEDVIRVQQNQIAQPIPTPPAPEPAPESPSLSGRPEKRVPLSRLRQRIAERLKEAQNTAAILTTFNEVDMGHVMALRERMKEAFEKKHGVRLGFMSFFVKACIQALKEIPAVNAEIQGHELIYKNYYDIGVAVGTPQGLVVPMVRDADQLSFAGVEKTIGALGAKARDGKLTMADLSGGTFTISNGGVYGSLMSTPILNPPQSGILGMHKIQKRPMVMAGDRIEVRPMMYLALSYDHRIIDGREAVTFLVRVKDLIEDPERLLLEI